MNKENAVTQTVRICLGGNNITDGVVPRFSKVWVLKTEVDFTPFERRFQKGIEALKVFSSFSPSHEALMAQTTNRVKTSESKYEDD